MSSKLKALLTWLIAMIILVTLVAPFANGTTEVAQAQEPVTVTWFVGLGAGGQPEQIEAQNAAVEAFNASHPDVKLEIIIVDNDVALDTLSTLIASGEAPDIVGPVGIEGSNAFTGQWADLTPLVEASGFDTSIWDPALVDFYRVEGEGLIGLPFGVFPSFIMYNRDLFDEAGLDYPPQVVGEPYADGDAWDVAKLQELAMLLTVDENGNDATSEEFDPEAVVQFGFGAQWANEIRAVVTSPFGAGSFVDAEGNAQIPDHWREGTKWYYDGIWTNHFIPSAAYDQSDLLANGNAFSSGHVAMVTTHLWYTCCLGEVTNWDLAAMPSYNGQVTNKLHADTFRILKASDNPEAAFEVLSYLVTEGSANLLAVYGGMPANAADQEAFLAGLDETYPQGVNWQVAIDALSTPDNPNHQSNMPNFNQALERVSAFKTNIESTPGLDIDAELDTLQADLQAIFDAAE